MVEGEAGPQGVDGDGNGSDGGDGRLQGAFVSLRDEAELGAVGGAVGRIIATLPRLKDTDWSEICTGTPRV